MILAALESDTAGIVLTNNILPPPNITALASERNIPLLLVLPDTYQIAKQIDDLEPLLTPTNTEKLSLLAQLIKTGVQIERLT
jgi:BioD-like phosphotransacetylase family protein